MSSKSWLLDQNVDVLEGEFIGKSGRITGVDKINEQLHSFLSSKVKPTSTIWESEGLNLREDPPITLIVSWATEKISVL